MDHAKRHRLPFALLLPVLLGLALCSGCGDTDPAAPKRAGSPLVQLADTFVLRAYAVDSVHLAGSFNGWNDQDAAYAFTDLGDGYTWRLVTQLPTGLHQYKFVLRQGAATTWLTDPAAVEVVSGGDPAQANGLVGREIPAVRDLPAPIDRTRLVVYEIAPNDFSTAGTFAGVIAGLTSTADLADLGVNAVELMPVTAPAYNGWGYDPSLYFAPNPAYGWPNFFALMVDRCHEKGIAVILDMVLNHSSGGSALKQLDTFAGAYNFTTAEANPWGMVELNWSNPALKEHLRDALLHWIETYNVDGFRFDYVAGEGWPAWEYIRDEIHAVHPDVLLIAEDFRYPNDGNSVTHGYDAQWGGNHTDGWGGGGNNFNQVLITDLTQAGFTYRGNSTPQTGAWGYAYKNMWATANVIGANDQYNGFNGDGFSDVKYLESHDENRLVWAVDTYGAPGAQAVGGLQKAELGAYALLTCVGIPMLYNGQEIGSGEYRPNSPTTYKIDWAAGDAHLRNVYRGLIDLRLNEPALRTETTWFQWRDGLADHLDNTLCYWRGGASGVDAGIVVALNFDDEAHTWPVAFPVDGTWLRYHPENGAWEQVEVSGGSLTLAQPASSGAVFKRWDGTTGVD